MCEGIGPDGPQPGGPGIVCRPPDRMPSAGTWSEADGTGRYGVGRCCPIE